MNVSLHERLVARRKIDSAVADAVDMILAPGAPAGPLQTEVLRPLTDVAGQIERLRSGLLGPLTFEQRQALNLMFGRLSHVSLVLREMQEGTTAATPGELVLQPDPAL